MAKKKRSSSERSGVFFDALFPSIPEGSAVEMRLFRRGRGAPVHRTWVDTREVFSKVVEDNADLNVYHGVALRRRGGGLKGDVTEAHALWAEVDTEKLGFDTMEVAKLVHAMDAQLRPSACIMSGHGLHFYWFLEEPLADTGAIDACNMVMRDFVGGDNVWNADRILRTPGSMNNKTEVAKSCDPLWLYPWARFNPDLLTQLALDSGATLWLQSDGSASFISVDEAAALRAERALSDDDAARIVGEDRRKTKNSRGELVWNRTRYHGGPGYVGLDEAIMLYTANAYCRVRPDADRDAAMQGIVTDTMGYIRGIWERDAGNESWDWRSEERDVWSKLRRWAAKWDGGLKAKSKGMHNGRKPATGKRISGSVASSR